MKDIIKIREDNENSPFFELQQLCENVKDLIILFRGGHGLRHQLTSQQRENSLRELAQPILTRWGSIQKSLETTLQSEEVLYNIVSSRDFLKVPRKQLKPRVSASNLVRGKNFVDNLKKTIAILYPIDVLIRKYQDDTVPLSEVVPDFDMIASNYRTLFAKKILTRLECDHLLDLVKQRREFLIRSPHGLANLLDPRFIGESFTAVDRQSLEESLLELSGDPPTADSRETVFRELTLFTIAASEDKNTNAYRLILFCTRTID